MAFAFSNFVCTKSAQLMSVIAEPEKKGRKVKGQGERSKVLSVRVSDDFMSMLNEICQARKSEGLAWCSQSDVLEIALRKLYNAE